MRGVVTIVILYCTITASLIIQMSSWLNVLQLRGQRRRPQRHDGVVRRCRRFLYRSRYVESFSFSERSQHARWQRRHVRKCEVEGRRGGQPPWASTHRRLTSSVALHAAGLLDELTAIRPPLDVVHRAHPHSLHRPRFRSRRRGFVLICDSILFGVF